MPKNTVSQHFTYCPMCGNRIHEIKRDGRPVQQCISCGYINWKDPKPTTSIIIERQGKILMLQRAKAPFKNYWVLPGGFCTYDETPQQTIIRETKEEIGSEPELIGIADVTRIDNDPRGIHIDMTFVGKIKGEIHLSSEHKAYRWVDPKALPNEIAYKHREVIKSWSSQNKKL